MQEWLSKQHIASVSSQDHALIPQRNGTRATYTVR